MGNKKNLKRHPRKGYTSEKKEVREKNEKMALKKNSLLALFPYGCHTYRHVDDLHIDG